MAVFLPPLRGSNINITVTVGYAHDVRFTHGFYEDCKRDGEFSLSFSLFDFILAMF